MNESDPLMSTSEVAELLGVSRRTLQRWRDAEHGPDWNRVGGKIKYRRASVNEWLDAGVGQR